MLGHREQEEELEIQPFHSVTRQLLSPGLRLEAEFEDEKETVLDSERFTDAQGDCRSPFSLLPVITLGKFP